MTLITELTDERLSRPNMDKWDIYWDSLRASLTREASKDARIRELDEKIKRDKYGKAIGKDSYPDSAACLDGKYGPRR